MTSKNKIVSKTVFLILVIMVASCADRHPVPVLSREGTLIYPSLQPEGILADISFYKIKDEQSGLPFGIDTIFTLHENDYLRVIVDFDNVDKTVLDKLLIHLDWVGPDGKSFYTKRIDSIGYDSLAFAESSVSISPEKRVPGNYILKVYYFRELIAQKSVLLLPENSINRVLADKLSPEIVFCEKVSKKTGERLGVDSVFYLDDKARVRAFVEMNDIEGFKDETLLFDLVWVGPDGEKFYSKDIELSSINDNPELYSSISIPSNKREPGKYVLKVYLFDELIATKNFVLK